MSKPESAADEHKQSVDAETTAQDVPVGADRHEGDIPDGGYGWVIVACMFFQNAATWGINTAFGVYLSFYRKTDFFPGASDAQFAFVGGLSIALSLCIAPLSNYLTRRYNFKASMILGLVLFFAGQILAAFSKKIWQLLLTQGVLFGVGAGLIFCATVSLPSQWFLKKRALALGIASGGSGAGALVLSTTTRLAIEHISLRWAFIINGLISLVLLVPVILLLKDRARATSSDFHPFQPQLLLHRGFLWVWLWGCFHVLGYVLALYTLATYATAGLNLTQAQGATLQSILSAGQMIGRPLCGIFLDSFGRINMTSTVSVISGLSCLLIWLFAETYGLLIFFALIQGLFGGIIWSACAPVTVEVVGIRDLGSALSILWVMVTAPSLVAEPIGVWLIDYSQTHLHRMGSDAYKISIGFAGACFVAGGLVILGAKRFVQGNWALFSKA